MILHPTYSSSAKRTHIFFSMYVWHFFQNIIMYILILNLLVKFHRKMIEKKILRDYYFSLKVNSNPHFQRWPRREAGFGRESDSIPDDLIAHYRWSNCTGTINADRVYVRHKVFEKNYRYRRWVNLYILFLLFKTHFVLRESPRAGYFYERKKVEMDWIVKIDGLKTCGRLFL